MEFKVKAPPQEPEWKKDWNKIVKFYKKFRWLIFLCGAIIIGLSYFYGSAYQTIRWTVYVIAFLMTIKIAAIPTVKYYLAGKDDKQKLIRLGKIIIVAGIIFGVSTLLVWWMKQTEWGLAFQRFLYGANTIEEFQPGDDINKLIPCYLISDILHS